MQRSASTMAIQGPDMSSQPGLPPTSQGNYVCSNCHSLTETCYVCQVCKDFELCVPCYKNLGHTHYMAEVTMDTKHMTPQEERRNSIQRCIESLKHACQCLDADCSRANCHRMKRVVVHAKNCKRKTTPGGCPICKHLIALCCYHAKHCQEAKCLVPWCLNVKQRLRQQQLQQHHLQIQLQQQQQAQRMMSGTVATGPKPKPKVDVLATEATMSSRPSKEWHQVLIQNQRNDLVLKLIRVIIPAPAPPRLQVVQCAKKWELDIYEAANCEEEYYRLLAEKVYKIQKEQEEKRLEKQAEQTGQVKPKVDVKMESGINTEAEGIKTEGIMTEGIKTEGIKTEGIKAEGIKTEAEGIRTSSIKTEGIKIEDFKIEDADMIKIEDLIKIEDIDAEDNTTEDIRIAIEDMIQMDDIKTEDTSACGSHVTGEPNMAWDDWAPWMKTEVKKEPGEPDGDNVPAQSVGNFTPHVNAQSDASCVVMASRHGKRSIPHGDLPHTISKLPRRQ